MAQFVLNQPISQADPVVSVEVSRDKPLPVGANRFQLIVVDNDGNQSDPVFLDIIVQADTVPTAVLDMVDANGGRVDATVPFGTSFILSASRSSDVAPGKLVEYRFTLVNG